MGQAPAVICMDPSSKHEAPLKQNKLINRTYAGSIRLLQCASTGCFHYADSVITPIAPLPSCFPSYRLLDKGSISQLRFIPFVSSCRIWGQKAKY